jgi:hypothetical protein|tara:strand:- start:681 stop:1193 length:513 start_codon:yes stop_codon:yes gene_type:complete
MLKLEVKDNFLSDKEFKIILNNLDRIYFDYRDKGKDDYTDGFRHSFIPDENNKWFFEKIKKTFFPNKKLKPTSCSYHLRCNKIKLIHKDDKTDYNFLLYLKGKETLFNGTGFFKEKELDTMISFKHNRAMFFNGRDVYHSDLQAFGESSFRYTINIFYKYNDNKDRHTNS